MTDDKKYKPPCVIIKGIDGHRQFVATLLKVYVDYQYDMSDKELLDYMAYMVHVYVESCNNPDN